MNPLRRSRPALPLALLLLGLASTGCTTLSSRVDANVPPPRLVAILPFEGDATLAERTEIRAMLREWLRVRYIAVLENERVDRLLAERGWALADGSFDGRKASLSDLATALGVEGLVLGQRISTSSLNVGIAYRRVVAGQLRCIDDHGRMWWEAEATVHRSGGPLLDSGQVIDAIFDSDEMGSRRGFLALAEEFLESTTGSIPDLPLADGPARRFGAERAWTAKADRR